MKLLLRRYPAIVNPALAFAIAWLAGLWTNIYTASSSTSPMQTRNHLLLLSAIGLLGLQCYYNNWLGKINRKVIVELLDLGIRFFVANSNGKVAPSELRAIVHVLERVKPGPNMTPQDCLVPRFCKSPVAPRDFGAIPVGLAGYRDWYVNVQAFRQQKAICMEPDMSARPAGSDCFIDNPSRFTSRTVIAVPIESRNEQHPRVLGTLTFDSTKTLSDLNWKTGNVINEATNDMLNSIADLVGKILSDEYSDT
jgi:hypothetical protein